jgi:hypothetical protein
MLICTDPPSSVSLLPQATIAARRLTAAAARSAWHCMGDREEITATG